MKKIDLLNHTNPNNFNEDGSFKYFYVEFHEDKRDIEMEREILKIADRLSKEEAIVRYKEDLEAYKYHLKEQEAIKSVQSQGESQRRFRQILKSLKLSPA